ncbi:MAG: glycosyltransferase [Eubacteriales bacterium]
MKKQILFIGISMLRGGTEKAFISMAQALDFEHYDYTLLLARGDGPLMGELPPQIKVEILPSCGDMFLLSGKNAYKTISESIIKPHPAAVLDVAPYFLRLLISRGKRAYNATKMWIELMKKYAPEYHPETVYDAAVAYWGDRTMFYMIDKVRAKRKITWLHFDYGNPPRDDSLYLPYFEKCDRIVTVSKSVDEALRSHLPSVAPKCVEMDNILNVTLIRRLALEGESFPDARFEGKRILSVCRISEQKGIDFIIPVLARLRAEKYNVRWYIVGPADEDYKNSIIEAALDGGVADMLILIGARDNPYAYVRDADIFALPSRYEGKPITVEEAKALFKPIVCSNYVSADEQLDGGRLGVICPIGAEGLYGGVKRLLDDERLCDKFTVRLSHEKFGNKDEISKFYDLIGQ